MQIWRIEDENGGGMYRGGGEGFAVVAADVGEFSGPRHPSPMWDYALGYYDIDGDERDYYKFSFATLAQMRQWVYRAAWRRGLDELGYRLNCYEVPDEYARRSNFQAVFHEGHAKLIETRLVGYADQLQAKSVDKS